MLFNFSKLFFNFSSAKFITVSYTLKTKPISKSEAISMKTKLIESIRNLLIFHNIKLNNGMVQPSDDILLLG